jgi:hypothetical protein
MPDNSWMSFVVHTKKFPCETLGMILRKAPNYLAWMIRDFSGPATLRRELDQAEIYINETDPGFWERHKQNS